MSRHSMASVGMIFWSVILAQHIFSAISKIIVRPQDTEAVVGHSTFLNCSTSDPSKGIIWYYYFPSRDSAIYIYTTGRIQPLYTNRALVDIKNDTGAFNLVIYKVHRNDSGRYVCQEEAERVTPDQHGTAELVVLHTNPVCQSSVNLNELIGPNDCGIEPDELRLSCTAAYSGNIPPVMEWKMTNKSETPVGQITSENKGNSVTYHLTTKIDLSMDGSSYLCQTTRNAAIPQLSNPSCTSDVLRILYVFSQNLTVNARVGDKIVCVANANVVCDYKWKWFKGDDMTTESSNATLMPKKKGSHRCEATCNIKNYPCTRLSMTVLVSANEDERISSDSGSIAWIVILVVVLVVLSVAAVVFILYVRWKKRKRKNEDEKQSVQSLLLQVVKSPKLDGIDLKSLIPALPFLAKGRSGEIYGPWKYDGKNYVWEKILLPPEIQYTGKETEILVNVEKWKHLDHINLVKFHCVLFQSPVLCIMMDYAEEGTVRRVLDSYSKNLPVQVVCDWAMQIAEGMNYLHEENVLHGQLKCGQILLMEHFDHLGVTKKVLKIGSFRISVESASNPSVTRQVYQWMSPEVLQGQPYLKSSDIWSYGVTVWEILTREKPYEGVKFGVAISEICTGSRNLQMPESCSPDLKDILQGCWERDQAKRPTFREILSKLHQYATEFFTINL